MKLQNRTQLKDYCLRKLGHPMLKINVTDDQIEDCIDDSIQFFNEYHYNATARLYHKHQITQTDIDNEYITIPDHIIAVRRLIPLSSQGGATSAIFDPVYQMRLNDLITFNHAVVDTDYIYTLNMAIQTNNVMITGAQEIVDYTRYENKLHIRIDWGNDIAKDDWVIVDAERILLGRDGDHLTDPSDVWDDMFLKEHCVYTIQYQWAKNLSKFEGISMPGGVTYSPDRLLSDANENLARIREDARSVWELPPMFGIG